MCGVKSLCGKEQKHSDITHVLDRDKQTDAKPQSLSLYNLSKTKLLKKRVSFFLSLLYNLLKRTDRLHSYSHTNTVSFPVYFTLSNSTQSSSAPHDL